MGVAISGLVAATNIAEADVFEIEQSGISKQITKTQLRSLLFSDPAFSVAFPQKGDSLTFNGTDWVPGARGGWRTIDQAAYTESSPASTSTITFAGGVPVNGINLRGGDYFSVGSPVRVEIGASTYFYGICTAVTDTLLTISGMILPSAAIISLAVGTLEMVKHVEMRYVYTTDYTTLGASVNVNYGLTHRWRGKTGYLVAFSGAHQSTAATTVINLKINGGSNVSTAGLSPAAGSATVYGAFVDSALGDLISANCAISDKQTINVVVPTTGAAAYYLVVCMTFIVP